MEQDDLHSMRRLETRFDALDQWIRTDYARTVGEVAALSARSHSPLECPPLLALQAVTLENFQRHETRIRTIENRAALMIGTMLGSGLLGGAAGIVTSRLWP